MADGLSSAAVVGSTGLVGSLILTTLASLASQPTVHAFARKSLPTTSSNVKPVVESDSSKWSQSFQSFSPRPDIFLSALGTTKAQAGSTVAQRKIDYDLNLSLAQAAKESGVKIYVLISSDAVSTKSIIPYSRMKADLEEAVKALNFPHTVIVKPGLLVGTRADSRPTEAALQAISKGLGSISKKLTDFWAQDADIVAKAAVAAGMQCVQGKEEGVWIVNQSEILRLGRKEWTGKAD